MKDISDVHHVLEEMEDDLDDIKSLLEKLLEVVRDMKQPQMP